MPELTQKFTFRVLGFNAAGKKAKIKDKSQTLFFPNLFCMGNTAAMDTSQKKNVGSNVWSPPFGPERRHVLPRDNEKKLEHILTCEHGGQPKFRVSAAVVDFSDDHLSKENRYNAIVPHHMTCDADTVEDAQVRIITYLMEFRYGEGMLPGLLLIDFIKWLDAPWARDFDCMLSDTRSGFLCLIHKKHEREFLSANKWSVCFKAQPIKYMHQAVIEIKQYKSMRVGVEWIEPHRANTYTITGNGETEREAKIRAVSEWARKTTNRKWPKGELSSPDICDFLDAKFDRHCWSKAVDDATDGGKDITYPDWVFGPDGDVDGPIQYRAFIFLIEMLGTVTMNNFFRYVGFLNNNFDSEISFRPVSIVPVCSI